jgi:hypothetical protein
MFTLTSPEVTGIDFSNTITVQSLSVLDFEYLYNGGGVALTDINNDGLLDIYFTGNTSTSKLYLNKGNLNFEDITTKAGVGTTLWANGVAAADINQDGFQDIYISVGGNRHTPEKERTNLLFINNGNETFTESAVKYGLADTGYGIQSVFFDYDRDGDLDMYLLRNSFVDYPRNNSRPKLINGEAASTDKLFRNNGDLTFTDVSKDAGILIEGFGLGVVVSDINDDGWPDVYVSNDFITNDLLYINNQDGTFTNQVARYLKHQTFNGMGADVADYNNDGMDDIVVLDMLPEDNKRWKLTSRGNSYDEFQNGIKNGYEHQYIRNTLQLNNGNGSFSEIGQLAGVEATEWSWSALFADYDNDGLKDLFISNGYKQDVINLDFIVYGGKEQTMGMPEASEAQRQKLLNELPGIKLHNYMYRNAGDLTFTDESTAWGLSMPTYSNGAAFGDLDNDGDLDLVTNNIDEVASVWESHVRRPDENGGSNYLRFHFAGPTLNKDGIGAKVYLRTKGSQQYQYFSPVRGYLSTVEPYLHFGMGAMGEADSVEVFWPDGKYQLLRQVKANQILRLDYADAQEHNRPQKKMQALLFEEVTKELGIDYLHKENIFVDFKRQPTLPHIHSRNGPGITVGDVNGDNLEDFYVGGAFGFSGALYLQTPGGKFVRKIASNIDSLSEELGVLMVDVDNDNDLDLYSVSGGSEELRGSSLYKDHLYLNDGKGNFTPAAAIFSDEFQSGSCVVASDYDKDGDLDLFIGGRVVPGEYPMPATSVILRNDTKDGHCSFVTIPLLRADQSPPGMVCDARWTDYDNDGWLDLVVVGEFMSIQFYHNEKGTLIDATGSTGLQNSSGWWNSLVSGDFDQDGDTDYVIGNLGTNSHFKATEQEPICIYASDFNKDGRIDPIMSMYIQGEKYVAHSRDNLIDQIIAMRARFRTYTDYANATFEESFLPEELEEAFVVCSERFESSYVENLGNGKFKISQLPLLAQFSPVYGMIADDYDSDGNLDVLLVGNSYGPEVSSGRDDSFVGLYLRGNGEGGFTPVSTLNSGFMADNDAKGMVQLFLDDGRQITLVGNNNDLVRAYATREPARYVRPNSDDVYALVGLSNGKTIKHEFYYGSTYLSQSSRALKITPSVTSIKILDRQGKVREIAPEGLQ